MRINNNGVNLAAAPAQTAPAQDQQKSNAAAAAGGDSVRVSSFAQLAISDSPRLAQIAADYRAGRYNVSPQDIAGSMIAEMMQD